MQELLEADETLTDPLPMRVENSPVNLDDEVMNWVLNKLLYSRGFLIIMPWEL